MNAQETQAQQSIHPRDLSWLFWPAMPLYPYGRRQTIRKEVVKDKIWTFDQLQGILYVVVPIRMTVVKLDTGGLLIYAPVAPTRECIRLVKELVAEHGDVKYIILPTISGLEHKVFVGPFARRFPKSQVFVAPKQWSFPVNLPLSWLGCPAKRTSVLPTDSSKAPFADQFDYGILGPLELGPGRFAEVAFFDKRSRTLLVTDLVVSVPDEPPEIVQLDPYPLLFHAKDSAFDSVEDNPENRRKGWQRISLFAFYFQPSALETIGWGQVFRNALKAPNRSRKGYFGLFPFRWQDNWKQSFNTLGGGGRLFVAPILQTLILNRAPQATIDWADKVASWNFERIVPCHLDSPIEASPRQFRQAFAFLEIKFSSPEGVLANGSQPLLEKDFGFLREIDERLTKRGIVPPRKEKI
ncbi:MULTISPECIES: DUF4336 domain-containing protein [unclassified Coleofasciculus]|uniref:DUF4336 domain-containing protein n=1 Tax=unclassified Coleofasciculus TaxID=2692782 RepID=UPI00187FE233|nr:MULTISPECIES: DUF4336 domain-containing protein [unclassified Coleofasciculus]MBE9126232.1 DUF4336 domain-containing protein [Coleofasciculus sp. LEGE 07081]MBE9148106.1 DUF4336 domain-containing protein [Coleofasciculus sp. LEGE 07092]